MLKFLFGDSDILLIAADGNLYSWNGQRLRKVGGSGYVISVAEHADQIYEGNISGGINRFTKLRNPYIGQTIRDTPRVSSLCSHNGFLYDATNDDDAKIHEIRETFHGRLIASRQRYIWALESHDNNLYDGGDEGIYESLTNKKISERKCVRLCSHEGILYGSNYGVIYKIFTGDKVTIRSNTDAICTLCSHNNRLLDADGLGSVWDTLTNVKILDSRLFEKVTTYRTKTVGITAMISTNTRFLK